MSVNSKPEEIAIRRSKEHEQAAQAATSAPARAYHLAAMRAFDKAAAELASGRLPVRAGDDWLVHSRSANAVYRVHVANATCNCPAGMHGRLCWHLAAAQAMEEATAVEDSVGF